MHIVSKPRNSARIGSLAVLPVFFDLTGKPVVVVGGSEPATWKIELLAAAGAHVTVFAPEHGRCEDLLMLASASPENGVIVLVDRQWSPDDLVGAALVVADVETDREARSIVEAAHRAGAPCNIIDQPEFCQFQFGSIVNRSPVVVGISTAGAAPILGQAVRRRIESLLPTTLSAWAKLAQAVRRSVMDKLEAGAQRRVFWERLADRAFGDAPPTAMDARVTPVTTPAPGRVTLVDAGPGEADLLTIKAFRALQSADVILYDDRVTGAVLELARREAKRLSVQNDAAASELASTLARQGKHVLRLTCGQDQPSPGSVHSFPTGADRAFAAAVRECPAG